MPFEIAEPLPKEDFLAVYREAIFLTQLLFAPFGLNSATADILGKDQALERCSSMFQQFEDVVSKSVFTARGFDDDRIIASMHKYVGENQDAEIIAEMQAAAQALQSMLVPPRVVDFDLGAQGGALVCAQAAALLLQQVLAAVVQLLYGPGASVGPDGEIRLAEGTELATEAGEAGEAVAEGGGGGGGTKGARVGLFQRDEAVWQAYGVTVPLSAFSPTGAFARHPLHTSACLPALTQCLSLRPSALGPLGSSSVGDMAGVGVGGEVRLSLLQYHTLLDLYCDSEEVQAVLQAYQPRPQGTHGPSLFAGVRSGALLNDLNLTALPSVSFISQLRQAGESGEGEGGQGGEGGDNSRAMALASQWLEVQRQASSCAAQEDFSEAEQLLSAFLYTARGDVDGAEKDRGVVLPVHIRVGLLVDR
ncbi:hypothetical protein B484DRAFT_234705 [Ochromonadaceae sp. CCMP2298]|nr:hypothetical protein B484DRAFT_234705 [Ochromonadaceae sp. CCMP2298]